MACCNSILKLVALRTTTTKRPNDYGARLKEMYCDVSRINHEATFILWCKTFCPSPYTRHLSAVLTCIWCSPLGETSHSLSNTLKWKRFCTFPVLITLKGFSHVAWIPPENLTSFKCHFFIKHLPRLLSEQDCLRSSVLSSFPSQVRVRVSWAE